MDSDNEQPTVPDGQLRFEGEPPAAPNDISQDQHAANAVVIPRWLMISGLLVGLAAVLGLGAFAFATVQNRDDWESEANDLEVELADSERKLKRSERDVKGLEDRVQRVSNEKAQVEDERAFVQAERDAIAAQRDAIAGVSAVAAETVAAVDECNTSLLVLLDELVFGFQTGFTGALDAAFFDSEVECDEADAAYQELLTAIDTL